MLIAIMLSVAKLTAIMQGVMLTVVMLSVVRLSVVAPVEYVMNE